RESGVEAEAVVGQSQGEIAAAVVSGALTVEEGARVVAVGSRLLSRLTGGGSEQVEGVRDELLSELGGLRPRESRVGFCSTVTGGEWEWGRAQGGGRVSLPGYAFQRRRHWLDPLPTPAPDVAPAGLRPAAHPLLAASVELADGGRVLTGRLTASSPGWLSGHR